MNLYFREGFESGGFLCFGEGTEATTAVGSLAYATTDKGQQGGLPKRSQGQLCQPQ